MFWICLTWSVNTKVEEDLPQKLCSGFLVALLNVYQNKKNEIKIIMIDIEADRRMAVGSVKIGIMKTNRKLIRTHLRSEKTREKTEVALSS